MVRANNLTIIVKWIVILNVILLIQTYKWGFIQ